MFSHIRYSLILLVLVFSTCNSPDSWDCLQSAGDEVVEIRHINPIKKVSLFDKLDVDFVQDGELYVEIRAGKNLIPDIKTEQADGQLTISNDNRCELLRDSDKRAKVIIHFDTLQNIEIFSSGSINSIDTIQLDRLIFSKRSNGDLRMTLDVDRLFIYSNEYGDAIFSGRINAASSRQEGVGLVNFRDCIISKADVYSQGPGTTEIYCKDTLVANAVRNGVIKVYGNPRERNVNIRDDGKVLFQ